MHRDECSSRSLKPNADGEAYSPFRAWASCWLEPLMKVLQTAEVRRPVRLRSRSRPITSVATAHPGPCLHISKDEHKKRLIELCLPRFIKLDRQALYYCTEWLQSNMKDTAALRVLIGLLRHARAHGMIETTGLQAESDGLVSGDSAIVSKRTMEVRRARAGLLPQCLPTGGSCLLTAPLLHIFPRSWPSQAQTCKCDSTRWRFSAKSDGKRRCRPARAIWRRCRWAFALVHAPLFYEHDVVLSQRHFFCQVLISHSMQEGPNFRRELGANLERIFIRIVTALGSKDLKSMVRQDHMLLL